MSVLGISSSNYSDSSSQNIFQTLQQGFQQLGKDLQAGNLTAAQSDFVTLQQDLPQSGSASSSQSSNPIAQAFQQLSQDLQAGNLTAAQQDFSTIQKDVQSQASQATQGAGGHHHQHHSHDSSSPSGSASNQVSQLLSELGQDLQSGDLSGAQQTYKSLQQDFERSGQSGAPSAPASSSNTISVQA
jgi:outer membrane protein assembly factor BamD (BamD/ComL family)